MRPVALVGSLSLDRVEGGRPRIGGAAYHGGRALRLLGGRGRIVSKCGRSDRRELLPRLVALGLPVTLWSGGATHLVQLGDVPDRAPDTRKILDLLMRLEPQARRAGGYVHALIGNHEAMNVYGDLRYVSEGEIAARDAGYKPYSLETRRAWRYWAHKAGCAHLVPEHAIDHAHKPWGA